jgi:hypothetical protein
VQSDDRIRPEMQRHDGCDLPPKKGKMGVPVLHPCCSNLAFQIIKAASFLVRKFLEWAMGDSDPVGAVRTSDRASPLFEVELALG